MAIILQFSAAPTMSDFIIRWFTQGAGFSHVDAVLGDGRLLGARSETFVGIPPGVQIRPPNYHRFSRKLVVTLDASVAITTLFYDAIKAEVGKPYDKTAIWGFIVNRDWRAADSWFCSELIGAKLEYSGWFPFPLATPQNKLAPDPLILAISARSNLFDAMISTKLLGNTDSYQ